MLAERITAGFQRVASEINQLRVRDANDTEALKEYVKSRGNGMITNGSGLLKNTTNFSRLSFDPTDLYAGYGCFTTNRRNEDAAIDEFIPVNPNATYEYTFSAKNKVNGTNNLAYAYLITADMDDNSISPSELAVVTVRLAAPWTAGQNSITIHVGDRPKFEQFFNAYKSNIGSVFVNTATYASRTGFVYPKGSYSRTRLSAAGVNMPTTTYANGVFTGPVAAATTNLNEGAEVSFAISGGTYIYPMVPSATAWSANRDMVNAVIPSTWTDYTCRFSLKQMLPAVRSNHANLTSSDFPNIASSVASAVAVMKVGWLLNRGTTAGNVTGLSAIDFRQV